MSAKPYNLPGDMTRAFCDCGRPATLILCRAKVCQRCYDIDRRAPAKDAKPDEWKMEHAYDNLHYVDEACTRWLKKKGLYSEKGFGISYGAIQSGVDALLAKL